MGISSGSSHQSGSSQFQSTPVNLQYPAYQNLAPFVAGGLPNLADQTTPTGPFNILNPNTGSNVGTSDPNNPLVGQIGSQEGNNLNFANSLAQGSVPGQGNSAVIGGIQTANNALGPAQAGVNITGEGFNTQRGGALGIANGATQTAAGIPAVNNFLNPNYAANLATSPQTRAAISSAVNPIIDAFKDTALPQIAGQFTAAGQRTANSTNTGSSAFDRAVNEAERTLQTNVGATAGSISNAAYQQGLNTMANAPTQAAQIGQGLVNAGTAQVGAGSAEGQTGATMTGEAATQAGIGAQGAAMGTQEFNNVLQNLQAQSLPRLVQQYGINQGLQLYQSQVQALSQVLGLGGQISQPAIAYNSSGSGQSSGSGKSGGFNLG